MVKKKYVVSLGAQKDLIEELCFGKCGEICIGEIDICGGIFLPCNEEKCDYSEKEVKLEKEPDAPDEIPDIIVRKLMKAKTGNS